MSSQAQIKEMAKLVMLSNRITEFHEKNLKLYPMVFFNGVKTANISYDFSNNSTSDNPINTNRGFVKYDIDLEDTSDNRRLERFEALTKAVRNLFWNDLKVEILFNGQLAYASKNNV